MSTPSVPYVYHPYPKVLYRAGQSVLVSDALAHAELGPGWSESPAEAAPAETVAATPPAAPPPTADTEAEIAAAVEQQQATEVHAASVSVVLEKLKGAPAALLTKVRGYEERNPKGARKSLLEGIDAALKVAEAQTPVSV